MKTNFLEIENASVVNSTDSTNAAQAKTVESARPQRSKITRSQFWADYMDEVNVLLDSRKFGKECSDLGIDPTTLATHIIFLGVGMRNKVMKYGIRSAIGNDYILYKDKFVSEDAMQFVLDYEPEKRKESTETAA